MNNLSIPNYQRPYKWTKKNVRQLIGDIQEHADKKKTAYRLGTIVFHEEYNDLNIVDGQQRVITLILVIMALQKKSSSCDKIKAVKFPNFEFSNDISKKNIYDNYQEISRVIDRIKFQDNIDFFLDKCEVVTFTLSEISEAFQFFDSQNARGKALEPHDILKAYHLRAFSKNDNETKIKIVENWEKNNNEKLKKIFAEYLFRIRKWTQGLPASHFSVVDIDTFKGVNVEDLTTYPYLKKLNIAHTFINEYNNHYTRKIDENILPFPFELNQTIINGECFFEMIDYYQKLLSTILDIKNIPKNLDVGAENIIDTINTYEEKNRTGDKFVRNMFDCLLMSYIDKFEYAKISQAIEYIFIWAYSLRLKNKTVRENSIEKYVEKNNIFIRLDSAVYPASFFDTDLPKVDAGKREDLAKIQKEFKNLGYIISN